MIFRRSLVRELTATAIGLFVVLLAILFTQSVIRILARAAGGAVAADGRSRVDRLQRDVLSQHPAVGRAVPHGAADAFALVPRQRDGRLVHLRPVAHGVPEADPLCSPRRSWSRSCSLSLFLSPWAEQRKIEYERQLESRDELSILSPGLFREFRRAGIVVYVESINPVDGRIRNVFLHSVDDKKDATTVARLGHLVDGAQRRPLRRARGRPALRRRARLGRVPR